jgi:hypothetical protein
MKDEYDFSNAQRGKFYKPDLRLIPPVRLESARRVIMMGLLFDSLRRAVVLGTV